MNHYGLAITITKKNACHSSIEEVAERVAANLHEYLKVSPDVIVGDGEPLPAITDERGWQNDYRKWLLDFHEKVGKPLSYTFIDINWGHKNWPQSLPMFANFARDVHMPIGIIYNAAPPDKIMTNEQWLQDAERNFTYIEHTIGIVSDWAIFASWVKFPGRAISDENGLGEDHLVKQYMQSKTK